MSWVPYIERPKRVSLILALNLIDQELAKKACAFETVVYYRRLQEALPNHCNKCVCVGRCLTEAHKYQLRVYLFQGRDLLPSDPDGLSGE